MDVNEVQLEKSDVQLINKNIKHDMEETIEKNDKPQSTFEDQNSVQESNSNDDCIDCNSSICACDKLKHNIKNSKIKANTCKYGSPKNEDKKVEKVKKDVELDCPESSPLKLSDSSKRLLGKTKAKQRLQAFSSKKVLPSIPSPSRSKKSSSRPKLVVSIETQYDENGEITEDSLVIRKPPKAGPSPQEKAKAVICEIEEIKRRETRMQGYNLKTNKSTTKLASTIHLPHNRPDSRQSKSYKYYERYDDYHLKSISRNRIKEPTSWADIKSSMAMNGSYRRRPCPLLRSMNMRMILHNFEEDYLINGTYLFAMGLDESRRKLYYKESVRFTSTTPKIMYSESPRTVRNLYPIRYEVFETLPKRRGDLMKMFINNCSSNSANTNACSKSKSQLWYPATEYLVDTDNCPTTTINLKEQNEKHQVDNVQVKSYGLAVLSESYQNPCDDSENEIDNNELIPMDILHENITPSNSASESTPKNKTKKSNKSKSDKQSESSQSKLKSKKDIKKQDSSSSPSVKSKDKYESKRKTSDNENDRRKKDSEGNEKEIKKSKKIESQVHKTKKEEIKDDEINDKQSQEIRTPDTDEYKSNWEVDDDFFSDNKSPIYENEIWDSDDNSAFSRKVSKKFNKNRYPDKFDYSDIAYNKMDTSSGLSDSFINSFGYRKAMSRSDKNETDTILHKSSKNMKDVERHSNNKNKSEIYKHKKEKRYSQEKHVFENKVKSSNKSKEDTNNDKKRRNLSSRINLNYIEEELERKRKSFNKHYDNIDKKIIEKEYDRAIETLYLETEKHKSYWDYDEENDDNFLSNRRERMWEEKSFWKEDDINEFRMKEKIQLKQTLEIQNEQLSRTTSSEFNENINMLTPKSNDMTAEKLEKEETKINIQLSDISNSSQIQQIKQNEKKGNANLIETVEPENTSKLVSEYEEFMKTVGFDISEELADKNLDKNDPVTVTLKDFETITNTDANNKNNKKIINSSSSSEDDSDEDYSKKKSQRLSSKATRRKRKKSSSSSSSESSSSSSSNNSSDSSSSDSSSESSSDSSNSTTKETNEEMIDPKNIKVEKLSDDESSKLIKTDHIEINNKNIKEEKIEVFISEKSKIDFQENVCVNTIKSTVLSSDVLDTEFIATENLLSKDSCLDVRNEFNEFIIDEENKETTNDQKQDNSNIENSLNISSTISLTLTPTKKFKPLVVLRNDSKSQSDLIDISGNHQNKKSIEKPEEIEADVDFTDIIMKRSREHDHSQSPDHKKICREKRSSKSPERLNVSDKYVPEGRRSPERSKSKDRRDDYRYRGSSDRSKDYYRERKRSDRREYRHSRRHYDSDSDRETKYHYHSDRYRSNYRSEKDYRSQGKDERRSEIRRSRSPLEKKTVESHSKSFERNIYDKQEVECASNSPLGGLKKSVADSTISDSELIPQAFHNHETEVCKKVEHISVTRTNRQISPPSVDSPLSPKRLSLDDRINQFLGIEINTSRPKTEEPVYTQNSYDDYMSQDYYERYANYMPSQYEGYSLNNSTIPPSNFYSGVAPPRYPPSEMSNMHSHACGTQVLQVGNVLQVVPTELPSVNDRQSIEVYPIMQSKKVEECVKTKVVQVGNMLQIVPTEVLPEVITTSAVPSKTITSSKTAPETKEVVVVQIPVVVKQEEKTVIDEVQIQHKLDKEKRHAEREQRRKERELKRIEKQKRKEQRLKIKTEKMIKRALLLETSENSTPDLDISDLIDNNDTNNDKIDDINTSNVLQTMWPPPASLPNCLDPPSKGILVKSGFSKLKHGNNSPLVMDILTEEKIRIQKTVKFADGVCPGEGTSPSAGEDLPSPPPPKRKLPKEQRYKKTKLKKTKKKVKVKIIRPSPIPTVDDNDDDSDDNLPPPPPPPGSPPPHLWPPKYSVENVPQFVGPPNHPPFPINHPPFANGAHIPPPNFVPPNAVIPPQQKPNSLNTPPPPPPVINFSSQPPPIFPPLGSDGPPPPPLPHSQFHDGRPNNMPVPNMYMTKFSKM